MTRFREALALYRMARSCDWPRRQSARWAFELAFSRTATITGS